MRKKFVLSSIVFMTVLALSGCLPSATNMVNEQQTKDTNINKSNDLPQTTESEVTIDKKEDSTLKNQYKDVTAAEAKNLIETMADLVIIDVSPHYAQGHLPGAVNYYLGDGSLDKAIPNLDKNKPYLVYCHVDSVARAGAQKLIDSGFKNIYRLQGNYSGWVDAGYEIEK